MSKAERLCFLVYAVKALDLEVGDRLFVNGEFKRIAKIRDITGGELGINFENTYGSNYLLKDAEVLIR